MRGRDVFKTAPGEELRSRLEKYQVMRGGIMVPMPSGSHGRCQSETRRRRDERFICQTCHTVKIVDVNGSKYTKLSYTLS